MRIVCNGQGHPGKELTVAELSVGDDGHVVDRVRERRQSAQDSVRMWEDPDGDAGDWRGVPKVRSTLRDGRRGPWRFTCKGGCPTDVRISEGDLLRLVGSGVSEIELSELARVM